MTGGSDLAGWLAHTWFFFSLMWICFLMLFISLTPCFVSRFFVRADFIHFSGRFAYQESLGSSPPFAPDFRRPCV